MFEVGIAQAKREGRGKGDRVRDRSQNPTILGIYLFILGIIF